jgi:hypothetical protein
MLKGILFGTLLITVAGCQTDSKSGVEGNQTRGGALVLLKEPRPGSVYRIEFYSVAPPDTMLGIARRFNLSLAELGRLNPGIHPQRLQVGDLIRISEKRIKE